MQSETIEEAIKKEEKYYHDWQEKNKQIDKVNRNAFRSMNIQSILLLLFSFLCLFSKVQKPNNQINLTSYDSLKTEISK